MCAEKLDLVFCLCFGVLMQRWLTVAALPITIMILILGYFSVKRENRLMFIAFITGDTAGSAYFAYKLYMIYRVCSGRRLCSGCDGIRRFLM